ncbi:MAG: dienelactone hydrolase family protein [Candidatus Binataceae bacterium]
MIEDAVEIRTADGSADGFIFRDEGGRRLPGVIHFTDIRGIRPAHREMARRLADKGYTVLLPNVFYRTGQPPLFDFPPAMGDERTMKRFAELSGPLSPDAMERDAACYVDFLAADKSVSAGPMGVVGYCFTGALAMRTVATRPNKIGAAASFHGGRLVTEGVGLAISATSRYAIGGIAFPPFRGSLGGLAGGRLTRPLLAKRTSRSRTPFSARSRTDSL